MARALTRRRLRALARFCRASGAGVILSACMSAGVATWRIGVVHTASPVARPAPVAARSVRPADQHAPRSIPQRSGSAGTPAPADGFRARPAAADPAALAAEVDRWLMHYLTDTGRRGGLETALDRMGRYERLIVESLRRHGAPRELLYLPIIESEFLETATSHAGATGIWQFMPGTARLYGLEVSAYVDERRDPVRSTDAAVRHLRDLYGRFGSWHLALAAYNAGSGRVDGALRRHAGARGGDDLLYWRVRPFLPRETRRYVPLYLAAAKLARDPQAAGLRTVPAPPLAFAEVWVPGGVPLDAVARQRGLDAAALRHLNPHLVRGMTPPGRRWPVRIPPGAPGATTEP